MSGLPLKRLSLSIVLLLSVAAALFAARIPSPTPEAVKLMPENGAVRGWNAMPDTLVFASDKDLTKIYNGGFELYTDNGVLDAAQQMYTSKSPAADAMVTIHRMTSSESAKQFLAYWKKDAAKQPSIRSVKAKDDGYIYVANGAANGYLIRDKYFVTVNVFLGTEKGRAQADALLSNISNSIGELVKPKPEPEPRPIPRPG